MLELTKFKTFPKLHSESRQVKHLPYSIKTPKTAIDGTYTDKNCPFTGTLAIRPSFIKGIVIKMKNEKTIVVRKNYLHYQKKYKRYERRNTKFNVHLSPCFFGVVNIGDNVVCAQTRPMSKTKHFVVVERVESRKEKFKVME